MNESMLTGESIPIIKQALSDNAKVFDFLNDHKHVLFSGTKCLESRKVKGDNKPVLAIVLRTGFATMKGSLVRSLIFFKPEQFKFYQDAFLFIACMFGIAIIGKLWKIVFNFFRFHYQC